MKSNSNRIIYGIITILLISCNESTPAPKENIKEYKRAIQELESTEPIKPEPLDTISEEMNSLKKHLKEEQYGEWPIPNTGN